MTTATETTAPAESDEYLTVGEVATELRVTPMTIYTEIHDGRLVALRVGRRQYRISRTALRDYKARAVTATSSTTPPAPLAEVAA